MKIKKFKRINTLNLTPSRQPNLVPITPSLYKLEEDWSRFYFVRLKNYKDAVLKIEVRKPFECDGQSSPPIAYPFFRFRPDGVVRAAALAHDAIYRHKGKSGLLYKCYIYIDDDPPQEVQLSQKAADQIYKATYLAAIEGCEIFGRDKRKEIRKAKMGYVILRMFGWIYWGSKKPPRG